MAIINIRIDSDIKQSAEAVFKKIGITPTMAITLFYYQVIRTNSIPFELKAELPNETTIKAINEIDKMKQNPDKYKTFNNADELIEETLKQNN